MVTNSRKFDHVTPLLRQLNWLPVKQLYVLYGLCVNLQMFQNQQVDRNYS